ncbi:LLM class flavin-dependent oxidoreductase [Massilia rhizosphaerae]|uniref:LLM class flavin-dependent oxidoreductase n=1 Tax=Massilia rhizosphaerae TaxID=2784389 RepID=UPI0018DE12A2
MNKRLILGAFMRPISLHTAWWKHPQAAPDANMSWPILKDLALKLERACFDAIFMADHLAVMSMPQSALRRSATITSFDPLMVMPALAACTSRIGLIATGSTSYEEPYLVARRFASLDHLSAGRAGWNIVTTVNPEAAYNFGFESAARHADRYDRAREFFDVVTGLWDGWDDDALLMDKDSGIFFDPAKVRALNHKGRFFSVKGPLNVARPVQGWPVITLAGGSDAARQMGAEKADLFFSNSSTFDTARAFYADVKARACAAGRDPDQLKILPANQVYVGRTTAEAHRKKAFMDDLVHVDSHLPNLSLKLGVDASQFDLDKPLPELPETERSKGHQQEWVALARRENLTVRELARRAARSGIGEMIGTPGEIADQMEKWLLGEACDGFIMVFHSAPEGHDDFVEMVVPELQRRGLFRTRYEDDTLRGNLGLSRPRTHG